MPSPRIRQPIEWMHFVVVKLRGSVACPDAFSFFLPGALPASLGTRDPVGRREAPARREGLARWGPRDSLGRGELRCVLVLQRRECCGRTQELAYLHFTSRVCAGLMSCALQVARSLHIAHDLARVSLSFSEPFRGVGTRFTTCSLSSLSL
jgi:hypothetical protein